MRLQFARSVSLIALFATAATSAAQNASAQSFQGPSSSQTPYVVPAPGWAVASLITTGDFDKKGTYRMVGIPDGLGAVAGGFRNGHYVADKSYMTVFMNHEISVVAPPSNSGAVRAHGQNGAFVSQWTIHLNSLEVRRGEDLIQRVFLWDGTHYVEGSGTAIQFSRFCSADLPPFEAFFNPRTGKGFDGRLYMNGEEISGGRAFAHVLTGSGKGDSYQLPHLGRLAFENSVANAHSGDKTIVVVTDDTSPVGQVYLYIGEKKRTGNPVERAGLVGGTLFGIKVTNGGTNYGGSAVTRENNGPINGTFVLQSLGNVSDLTGAQLETNTVAAGITGFARPEDNAWDTRDPRAFYFVVTGATVDGKAQSGRLYRVKLDSLSNPTGGTIELIVDRAVGMGPMPDPTLNIPPLSATTGVVATFDNITVDGDGMVIVLEDPGNHPYISKVWRVNPTMKTAQEILHTDAARFGPPPQSPYEVDEENSGVIEVTALVRSARWFEEGRRYFLADLQDHHLIAGEEVEGGQLYMLVSPKSRDHHDRDDDDRDDDHGRH